MSKYFNLWLNMSLLQSQIALRSTFGASLFFIAKLLRFSLFIVFLLLIEQNIKTIAGYSLWQMVLFYATFNLIDTIPQALFREVYRFRQYIVEGNFDYILTRPISPLFRALLGGSDILDTPIIVLSLLLVSLSVINIGNITTLDVLLFALLTINGLAIALSFHIFTLCMGILTTSVDHTIMVYRDLTQLGRFPVDIYLQPIRGILTFVIPIGIMITFPPQALMNLLNPELILVSFAFSFGFLFASLKFWQYAITKYQSASS